MAGVQVYFLVLALRLNTASRVCHHCRAGAAWWVQTITSLSSSSIGSIFHWAACQLSIWLKVTYHCQTRAVTGMLRRLFISVKLVRPWQLKLKRRHIVSAEAKRHIPWGHCIGNWMMCGWRHPGPVSTSMAYSKFVQLTQYNIRISILQSCKLQILHNWAEEFFAPLHVVAHLDVLNKVNIYAVRDSLGTSEPFEVILRIYYWSSFAIVLEKKWNIQLVSWVNVIWSTLDFYLFRGFNLIGSEQCKYSRRI